MSCQLCEDGESEYYVEIEQRIERLLHAGVEVVEESNVMCETCKSHVESLCLHPRYSLKHTEEL